MVHDRGTYLPVDTEDAIHLRPVISPAINRLNGKSMNEFPSRRHPYFWPVIQITLLCLSAANLALLVYTVINTFQSSSASSSVPRTNTTTILLSPCGNSSTTALASGCRFDIISFAWLPPACDDRELSDEFQASKEWSWYEDQDGLVPVTQDEALTGRYPYLFVNFEYHLTHCTYLVS